MPMAFQVAPRAIGHRTLPAVLVVLAIVGVITFAVVTSDGSSETVAGGSPSPAALQAAPSGGPGGSPDAAPIDCHDLGRVACDDVVWAVRHVLGAQRHLSAIGGWRSLLCDSTLDCPARLLDGRRPVGSAVVALRSGDTVWVNVMARAADASPTGDRSGLTAWVVRWLPKPSATP